MPVLPVNPYAKYPSCAVIAICELAVGTMKPYDSTGPSMIERSVGFVAGRLVQLERNVAPMPRLMSLPPASAVHVGVTESGVHVGSSAAVGMYLIAIASFTNRFGVYMSSARSHVRLFL